MNNLWNMRCCLKLHCAPAIPHNWGHCKAKIIWPFLQKICWRAEIDRKTSWGDVQTVLIRRLFWVRPFQAERTWEPEPAVQRSAAVFRYLPLILCWCLVNHVEYEYRRCPVISKAVRTQVFLIIEDYVVKEVRIQYVSMKRLIFHIRITAEIF